MPQSIMTDAFYYAASVIYVLLRFLFCEPAYYRRVCDHILQMRFVLTSLPRGQLPGQASHRVCHIVRAGALRLRRRTHPAGLVTRQPSIFAGRGGGRRWQRQRCVLGPSQAEGTAQGPVAARHLRDGHHLCCRAQPTRGLLGHVRRRPAAGWWPRVPLQPWRITRRGAPRGPPEDVLLLQHHRFRRVPLCHRAALAPGEE